MYSNINLILFYFSTITILLEVCWKVCAVDTNAPPHGRPSKGKDLRIDSTYALRGCRNPPIIDLRELLGTYSTVYPQHLRNSTRLLNLNREDKDARGRCPDGTKWTLTQLCRMEETFGSGYVFNFTTQEMIKYPKARLYWNENHTGSSEDFSRDKQNGSCQILEQLRERVNSVETFGTCLRLFYEYNCRGWSLAVYPGSGHSLSVLNTLLKKVVSVGPCIPGEFLHASFQDPVQGTITKNPEFSNYNPDLVYFFSTEKFVRSKFDSSARAHYILGPNRTEYLQFRGSQPKVNVTNEEPRFNETDAHKFLDKQDGDVLAYAIPLNVGGPRDRNYNIFLASPTCVEEWNSIVSNITTRTDFLKDIIIEMNFVYGKSSATRPQFFYYYITYTKHDSTYPAWYGRVLNGNLVSVDLRKKLQRPAKIPKNTKRMRLSVGHLFKRYKIWSNDSIEAYSNSTIHNFEHHKLQERSSLKLTCLNFVPLEDIQETPIDLENDYVPAGYMQDLIGTHPFALLFSGENYTGASEKRLYHDGAYCRRLNFENGVQSLETFGKCVRIYQDSSCYGTSISVYPGSENSHAILKLGLSRAESIRPCDYFAFSNPTFKDARTRYILKNGKPKRKLKTL